MSASANEKRIKLCDLRPGERGIVRRIVVDGTKRRHLLDLGFIPGTAVDVVRRGPAGDPTAFRIRGTTLALRREQSEHIHVDRV